MLALMRQWVFAYGSNLDLAELSDWFRRYRYAPSSVEAAVPAQLHQHALVWNYYSTGRAGGAANVQPRDGSLVFGAALLVTPEGLHALDHKEGAPRVYQRQLLPVERRSPEGDAGGWIHAWVYRVTDSYRSPGHVAPTRYYRERLLMGAQHFSLPRAHVCSIEAVATCD